ncbi:MAG: hypothetical protein ABSG94_03985 [Brevinematales bacterium]|jgi:hypothetical protein
MDIKKITIRRAAGGGTPTLLSTDEWSDDKKTRTVTDFDTNGAAVHKQVNRYDGSDRLILREDSYLKENISTAVKSEYGNMIKIDREYFLDGGNTKTVTVFDKEGHVLSIEKFDDEDPSSFSGAVYNEYDDKGLLKASRIENSERNITESATYTYDAQGRDIRTDKVSLGIKSFKEKFYDDKGRLVRVSSNGGNSPEEEGKAEIKYNEDDGSREEIIEQAGAVIIQRFNADNVMTYQERREQFNLKKAGALKISYDFDEGGLLRSVILQDDSNPLNSYTNRYEYEFFGENNG